MSDLRKQYDDALDRATNLLNNGHINGYINALVEVYYFRKLMILAISN